jgi:hypothetical protein
MVFGFIACEEAPATTLALFAGAICPGQQTDPAQQKT